MKTSLLSGIVSLMLAVSAWGGDVSQALQTAARQARGALCRLECTIDVAGRETKRSGIAICIDASQRLFMTLAIPARTPLENIKEITLTPPGKDAKPLRAKLQGIDSLSNLSFLRCRDAHAFTAVQFLAAAGVSTGDLVVSAGLYTGSPNHNLSLGSGYISSEIETPNRILRVTGGTLSMVGSVVFNADGKAIGLVTTQPYLPFQMYRRQRPAQTVLLRNLEQTVNFTPVEEFAQILTNIPGEGVVRRPNWIGGMLIAVPEGLRDAKGITTPAVMLDRVLPGTSAARAGLKDRDIVIAVDGAPIDAVGNDEMTAGALRQKLARKKPGEIVTLTVQGQSGPRDVKLKIEPMPMTPSEAPKLLQQELEFALREKVPFDTIKSDAYAKTPGLIVLAVGNNSPASRGRLRQGDLVTAIDGKIVSTVAAAETAIQDCLNADPPRNVSITVLRGTTSETLVIKAPGK